LWVQLPESTKRTSTAVRLEVNKPFVWKLVATIKRLVGGSSIETILPFAITSAARG
jgi:hypothetical protein